jgi:hypothetical protein
MTMAEPKTIPTAESVSGFFEGVEPDAKRSDARIIDAIFRRVTVEEPKM